MGITSEMTSSKLNFKCTYKHCTKYFETEKLMKRHKRDDPDHFYCKKCDIDCKDWNDLTKHKVAMMSPWLGSRVKHDKDNSPPHIVCEFCGQDFKTFEGRKDHRRLAHPADQAIFCPGPECGKLFTRASHLISHFEENECPDISYEDYIRNVTYKHVMAQIWKAPKDYEIGCNVNSAFVAHNSAPGYIGRDDDTEDGQEGGIPLLDADEDEARQSSYRPLQPQPSSASTKQLRVKLKRENVESWPRLPGLAPSQLSHDLSKLLIGSPAPSTPSISASTFAKSITSTTKEYAYTESYPALGSAPSVSSNTDYDDTASDTTTTAKDTTAYTKAWTRGNASYTLFKDTKSTLSVDDSYWQDSIGKLQDQLVDNATDLLSKRLWDPSHRDYNPERFLSDAEGKYCCPFGECYAMRDTPSELSEHLVECHMTKTFRCPACFKIFKKGSSLMAHAEAAGGKCKVQHLAGGPKKEGFGELLDVISGGFLDTKEIRQPPVLKFESAVVKQEDVAHGVMSHRYEAKDPGSYRY